MINITVESLDSEESFKVKERLHNALVGSPAYINSEIAICDVDEKTFILAVGNCNDDDCKVHMFMTNDEINTSK